MLRPRPDLPPAAEIESPPEADLRPAPAVLLAGAMAVAIVSFASLTWPAALASTLLGTLMVAGAEVDARTFLLPDTVTLGALASGIVTAAALDPIDAGAGAADAALRAAATAAVLLAVRLGYAWLRQREGLGLGDVKLAAAIGAWLPLEVIPLCFALAAGAALMLVLLAHLRGARIEAATCLPFGAFLCPALWLVFYLTLWSG
jgi:leader peptidase (prepilin peptidase)/N-methyltransferase